jgi:putative endonuclease
VYVLQSQSRSVTYVGISKDVEARLAQHNGEAKGGAKSTRAARPWALARTLGPFETRGEAQSVEYALKQQPPHLRLMDGEN